jgi:4a-hydroxytetrahydrobiopterin dehydratase
MPRPQKLPDDDVADRLKKLPLWTRAGDKLRREYKFADFVTAFGFMAQGALHAERLNHHPEWSNVYDKVVVELQTHDAGGITVLDFELAGRMESIADALLDVDR